MSVEYRIERVDTLGDWRGIPEGVLVLERSKQVLKWAFFVCPCGCREVVAIPLSGRGLPLWVVRDVDGMVTLDPAVDRTNKCGARFRIVCNQVIWN